MDELGFDFNKAASWFQHHQEQPYVLVELTAADVAQLLSETATAVRRCYIPDTVLTMRASKLKRTQSEILAAKLPDPGSTMAGDFGEILCYFYQSTKELPSFLIGAKKWRLKQSRTQPAPMSDLVQFLMPNYPNSSSEDAVLCAEVKLKSTAGKSTPIVSAIKDCEKDRVSRLATSLVWLKERALEEDLGDVDLHLLERFIHAIDHPPVSKRFRAMAVICSSLLAAELKEVPSRLSPGFTLVVIGVPNLKQTYEDMFTSARATVLVQ
ncbi:MAG: DUF1837 domain-containing protein [Cyanobacteria bacterium PR.023]|nr:DUF1837 domain-containing protein [Cyanobacteria bacterium PR.023]